jgi:hypothetical protein
MNKPIDTGGPVDRADSEARNLLRLYQRGLSGKAIVELLKISPRAQELLRRAGGMEAAPVAAFVEFRKDILRRFIRLVKLSRENGRGTNRTGRRTLRRGSR